jgi:hypothetical protein
MSKKERKTNYAPKCRCSYVAAVAVDPGVAGVDVNGGVVGPVVAVSL